jgi:hypothetical protein
MKRDLFSLLVRPWLGAWSDGTAFVLAGALLLATTGASAMDVRRCDDPRVFSKTPVNVVILPYTYTGDTAKKPSPALKQLTVLMQQDSLLEMVKYERIAIVNLVRPPDAEPCDPERIWGQITGAKADGESSVRKGGGLVMLWGRVYEEGSSLFLQSYMRFGRVGQEETIETSVPVQGGEPATFRGALPPRRITGADLSAITSAFEKSAQVRKEPRDDAPIVRTSPDPNSFQPFGYSVNAIRDGWMQVQSFYGGPGGWVKARVDATSWPLRERVPELHFVDAAVGYLHYRVATESTTFKRDKVPPRWVDYVARSLAQYEERSPRAEAPVPAALGQALGTLYWIQAARGAGGPGYERALQLFAGAGQLVPYNAGVRNLRNAAEAVVCCAVGRYDVARATGLMSDLLDALLIDTDGGDAMANLGSFHRLVAAWPDVAERIGGQEIARQQAALQSIRQNGNR